MPPFQKKKHTGHGKSIKLPKKITRQRSWLRTQVRKDARVKKSSHGKFANRQQLMGKDWIPPVPHRGV